MELNNPEIHYKINKLLQVGFLSFLSLFGAVIEIASCSLLLSQPCFNQPLKPISSPSILIFKFYFQTDKPFHLRTRCALKPSVRHNRQLSAKGKMDGRTRRKERRSPSAKDASECVRGAQQTKTATGYSGLFSWENTERGGVGASHNIMAFHSHQTKLAALHKSRSQDLFLSLRQILVLFYTHLS